jgi:ABC-type nitrate/sulfonate/bicarbonate transport system permease component
VRPGSSFVRRWWLLLAALVVWELAARAASTVYVPPPTEILGKAYGLWLSGPPSQLLLTDSVYSDVLPSIGRVLGGWLVAAAIGIVLGIALGRSRHAVEYAGPLLAFFRSLPTPTLVPVFLVLFSIGTEMQLATIIFGSVWAVLLNTIDGARSIDQSKVDTVRAFRISRPDWLLRVVLPAAMPKIFAGLRVSLSQALILMVVSEMVGSTNGIGYRMLFAQSSFDYRAMWAGIALLGILGYAFNTLVLLLEKRVLGWQPKRAADADLVKTGG